MPSVFIQSAQPLSPRTAPTAIRRRTWVLVFALVLTALDAAERPEQAAAQRGPRSGAHVHLELVTEPGFPLGGERKWIDALRPIRDLQIRIRAARAGDRPDVERKGTEAAPVYYVTGILTARNELRVPGGRFRISDRAGIEKWLQKLRAEGTDGATAERGAFGMTAEQLVEAHEALSQPITVKTQGKQPAEVLQSIARGLPYEVKLAPVAAGAFREGAPVADELEGLAAGTSLAAVLRPLGLVLTLDKPLGEKPLLVVTRFDQADETWPVGWPSEKSPRSLIPALFEFLSVEIKDVSLTESLAALEQRLEVPFLLDHNSLARHRIVPDEVKVSFPSGRSYYKGILDRLLTQARLKSELRVDEAGKPFLWITTIGS